MNEEKKENTASAEPETVDNSAEEKSSGQNVETGKIKKEEASDTETGGSERPETRESAVNQSTEAHSQTEVSDEIGKNGSGGTVPPEDHSRIRKKEKKQHHDIWKNILKYLLIFLVAGCGAFAGSYTAEHVYHEKMEKEAVRQFSNFGNMIPFDGDNSENESSGPALGIVIQQTDDGIEIVGFAKNGNAEKAGLKTGDIIKKVDGKSYDSVSEITSYISSKSVGDKVKVTVSRNGDEKTYSVKLVKKDLSSYSMPSAPSDHNSDSDDQNQPKALPGTDGENSQLQG